MFARQLRPTFCDCTRKASQKPGLTMLRLDQEIRLSGAGVTREEDAPKRARGLGRLQCTNCPCARAVLLHSTMCLCRRGKVTLWRSFGSLAKKSGEIGTRLVV